MNEKNIFYEIDGSRLNGKVSKVYNPSTKEEIQKIVKESTLDIVPRGSGTNLVGGCFTNNSIVIDMRKLNKVTGYDPKKQTITVEAGSTLKELNEKLIQINKEFPVYFNELSTIGGMIAINLIGEKSMRYGTMKDNLEEVEFINGRGEIIKLGRADISEVCGMEGITGIITKAKLKIINLSEKSLSLFQSENLEEVISIARKLKLEKEIVMLKFYSREVSSILGFPKKYHIIVGFDSDKGKIKGEEYEKIMKKIKKDYYYIYSNGYYESEDVKLFYDRLLEFIKFLEELNINYIGDLGMAIINTFFKETEKEKIIQVVELIKKIGSKKGRYGIGTKRKYLLDNLEKKIILRIKKRHDPFLKFNKGKLIDVSSISLEESKEARNFFEESNNESEIYDETRKGSELKKASLGELKSADEFIREIKKENQNADSNVIRNIMTNTYKNPSNGKTVITNLKTKSKNKELNEKDLINSIMTNKFKDNTNLKDEDKKNGS